MEHDRVIEKARQLGQAIADSETFIAMRAAEQAMMNDRGAVAVVSDYQEKKALVTKLISAEPLDKKALAEASAALSGAEEALNMHPLVLLARDRQKLFSDMMTVVNREIQSLVTGDVPDSCGGHCDTCGAGCRH